MAEVTMTSEIAKAILMDMKLQRRAEIFDGTTVNPFEVQSLTLDLSTARLSTDPLLIGFPFRSLFMRSATDNSVAVTFRPQTRDSFQSGVDLKLNDSLDFDIQQSGGYLSWAAQSGKSITIVFFVNARFVSGSQVSQTAGGVAIVDGSSFTRTVTTLAAATATSILSTDTTRKISNIQNNTGASIFVGDSTITGSGATVGYEVAAGSTFQWRNTAQLYAYSVAGGPILLLTEF